MQRFGQLLLKSWASRQCRQHRVLDGSKGEKKNKARRVWEILVEELECYLSWLGGDNREDG